MVWQEPAAVQLCIGSLGWVSVVKVPTCWAEAAAAKREDTRVVLEIMVGRELG
jgi:hypothetical protein